MSGHTSTPGAVPLAGCTKYASHGAVRRRDRSRPTRSPRRRSPPAAASARSRRRPARRTAGVSPSRALRTPADPLRNDPGRTSLSSSLPADLYRDEYPWTLYRFASTGTAGRPPQIQSPDGRTRVLPLQAVGRGRRSPRLLDDDRGSADRDLSDDLRDAWERLRETAADFGDQRIYASHNSIMFSRKSCYFFVRPKKKLPRRSASSSAAR